MIYLIEFQITQLTFSLKFLNITSHPESIAGKEITGLKNLFPRPEIRGVDE